MCIQWLMLIYGIHNDLVEFDRGGRSRTAIQLNSDRQREISRGDSERVCGTIVDRLPHQFVHRLGLCSRDVHIVDLKENITRHGSRGR